MRKWIVQQLDYDLTPVAGLSLVGHYLNALRPMLGRIDAALPDKGGVANSDVLRAYLGLLAQGKSDFDAIENYRGDAFFKQALGIGLLPSSPTLRQRIDARAVELFDYVPPMRVIPMAQRLSTAGPKAPILTRLDSGKFDTNYLVCQLGALAMNMLRLIGQRGLLGPDAPVRHAAKRRRLKTVMQELIYRAGRLIETGRRLILGLGANDRSARAFARVHGELFAACTT